jgi:hypothetical protein
LGAGGGGLGSGCATAGAADTGGGAGSEAAGADATALTELAVAGAALVAAARELRLGAGLAATGAGAAAALLGAREARRLGRRELLGARELESGDGASLSVCSSARIELVSSVGIDTMPICASGSGGSDAGRPSSGGISEGGRGVRTVLDIQVRSCGGTEWRDGRCAGTSERRSR